MARISKKSLMYGVRGMLGGQVVVKKRKGKPYLAGAPNVNPNRKPGKIEQLNRDRFKWSNEYASEAIQDPAVKMMYAARATKQQTANNVAFSDAFHPPEILAVLTHGYCGVIGNVIVVQARDNFAVVSVRVSIFSDSLIEEGDAVDNGDGLNWMYTVTAGGVAKKIVVKAYDRPGNETVKEVFV